MMAFPEVFIDCLAGVRQASYVFRDREHARQGQTAPHLGVTVLSSKAFRFMNSSTSVRS
jgi:hypothetical protein